MKTRQIQQVGPESILNLLGLGFPTTMLYTLKTEFHQSLFVKLPFSTLDVEYISVDIHPIASLLQFLQHCALKYNT